MTEPTSKYIRLPALSNDWWESRMILGMPDRCDKTIAQLTEGICGSAARHAPQDAVIGMGFEIGRVHRICPRGRLLGTECHRGRREHGCQPEGKDQDECPHAY